MEEVQSTEVLAREILDDARKKAMRILKSTDDTVHTQGAEWERKTKENITELEKKYTEQCELAAVKIMDRLPVDKRRIKVEKIENLLQEAVDFWYKSLNRSQILELLKKELVKRLASCEGIPGSAQKHFYYFGLERNEAETIAKTVNGTYAMEEVSSASRCPFIILETEKVRIIASVQDIINFLLEEKRAELVEALVGRTFIEEEI
jgi:hypothetical protein